ncbi:LOW QUALITY PROTEIN: secretion-regulating guanine nucleotide exchange factor-like [Branchiostoma floridae]|uniref:LOW QUALITY PROTEIN: secretion-regulating guanine nucleotide exchange factor-like n=1 Tax=Branchiostoma floridae TaxID=7739 RepID=A0A9J7KZ77_BRAFL|nr:LOW QUALITY PROTEIN: secretion-regulating guanine nucleotide exchange factor-like [Branchiostoma floridae]
MEEQLIFSWGANSYGQLGVGHRDDRHSPQQLEGVNFRVKAVTGGGGHTVFISAEGKLFVCGWNQKGQLGLGHREDVSVLTQVTALTAPMDTVSCGWDFTLAVTEGRQLFSWGSNAFGQLGVPEVKGHASTPTPVQTLQGVRIVSVAAGLRHAVALDDTGSVWTWGAGKRGQLGRLEGPTVSKQPGKVQLDAESSIVAVKAGSYHSIALTGSGDLYVWGRNDKGQLTNRNNDESSAKTSNHTGHDTSSPASTNHMQDSTKSTSAASSSINQLESGTSQETVSDPTLKCVPHKTSATSSVDIVQLPVRLDSTLFNGKKVVQINSGWTHLAVITEDRRVWTWGRADYGQLGRFGDRTALPHSCSKPAELSSLYGVKQLQCGSEHNVAIIDDQVVCWGWNEHGMCGDGGEEDVLVPKAVEAFQGYTPVWVSTGAGHTMVGMERSNNS